MIRIEKITKNIHTEHGSLRVTGEIIFENVSVANSDISNFLNALKTNICFRD